MILLYSSLLKGEEAKIIMTPGDTAEGPHSAIGKINRCINSSRIGMQMPYSAIVRMLQKICRRRGHNDLLEERIWG